MRAGGKDDPMKTDRPHILRGMSRGRRKAAKKAVAGVSSVLIAVAMLPLGALYSTSANAALAPDGNGFVVTTGDLSFILKQIKIAERHTTTLTASNPCGTLVNQPGDGIPDAEQVPDYLTSYGLRTVDGSCNNLKAANTATFAASDQPFLKLTDPSLRDAEPIPNDFFGPGNGVIP